MTVRKGRFRGSVLVFLVVSVVLSTTGIPLPVPTWVKGKDRSVPFPCMDRPCGCMNADQCEHQCCCCSKQEKETWAASQAVEDESTCPTCKETAEQPVTWVLSLSALKCQPCDALGLLAVSPAVFAVANDLPTFNPEAGETLWDKDSTTPHRITSPLDRPPRRS
jgi:hypothetical protein